MKRGHPQTDFEAGMVEAKRIAKNTPMVTYNELIGAVLFYGCISFLIGLAIGWWFL